MGAPAAAAGVKLLLDEMLPPVIAEQLRDRGHDVVAVAERDDLVGSEDPHLFEAAQAESHTVVTENVSDFLRLDRSFRAAGREHHGLVFVRKRGRRGEDIVGEFVRALDAFLEINPDEAASSVVTWI